jgi:hypothetical protein
MILVPPLNPKFAIGGVEDDATFRLGPRRYAKAG